MQIKQLIFDCDNTLVLSEEYAFEACADLVNTILEKKGLPDRYTGDQLIVDFVGQNFRGMMAAMQKKFGFTLSQEELEQNVKAEEDAVIAKLEAKAQPTEGVMPVLDKLYKEKTFGFAIVSSSAIRRIRASIVKVDQDKYFPYEHVFSAVNSLPKPKPKPDPAVYLFAMDRIGVKPEECIAVEDSRSGAASAVRAGIPCIAYVGCYHGDKKQDAVAEILIGLGCKVVMKHWNEFERCIAEIEAM